MRGARWWIGLSVVCLCAACTPNHAQAGASASGATAPRVTAWGDARSPVAVGGRMDFPTGQRIVARPDVAASLRDGDSVADAVVILDDGRGYVGLRLMPDARLTPSLTNRVQNTVRRFAPGVGPVFVTADAHAFADLAAFQRYLVSGRTVTGILMTWRSILQRTWGITSPASGGSPPAGR